MASFGALSNSQRIAIGLAALLYTGAGLLHFIRPAAYLKIVPAYLPWHQALVGVSGAFEVMGGLGLLVGATRRPAAWGLVLLLISVFPANLFMAMHPAEAGAASIAPALRWGRLPVQPLLIWWLLWCTRPRDQAGRSGAGQQSDLEKTR